MIPLIDLKAQYEEIGEEIERAALRVLASAHYVQGEEVEAFEHDFAAFCGVKHAIAVNTGTSALHLALLAANIGPGDEVITTPMTFVATVSAICYAGARPVLVDIDPETFTLDPEKFRAAITDRTRAVIPVHLYGQMADMEAIGAIARKHGIAVIEDACQAHGAELHGKRAGSFGVSGCFSFYPGKNLGACGEGGAVVTNDDAYAEKIRMLRDWGQSQRYHHVLKGYNYRMDNIQGAILRVKLRHLEAWTEARRTRAQLYGHMLGRSRRVTTPKEATGRRHVWHVYALRAVERDRLRETLLAQGVQTGLHYPVPVHLQPAHADLGYGKGDFPITEALAHQEVSLPIYPEMTVAQIERVVEAVEEKAYAE